MTSSSKYQSIKSSSTSIENKVDSDNRHNQIKQSLFPDDEIDLSKIFEYSQRSKPFSSMVQLNKATQKFKFNVTYFSDYIIDCDGAIQASGDFAKLLNSSNETDVTKSLEFIHNLCKKQASRLGLASTPEIINGLKKELSNKKFVNCNHAISSLQHISKGEQGARNIFAAQLIPTLLEKLKHDNKKVMECSLSILDNLMTFVPQSRDVIRQSNGVKILVELLKTNTNVKVLTIIIDCLHKLAYNHQESKMELLNSRGSVLTVQFLRQYTYEKLLFSASRLLKVLSVCNSNKPILIEAGALEALSNHMRNKGSSERLVQSCLWSVRNLSDHSSHLTGMQTLIQLLTDLLSNEDSNLAICAIGSLCNLTSTNKENKTVFVQIGGVDKMCQIMCDRIHQEEVVEPGAACLRHVTHSHPNAEIAVNAILKSPLLSNLAVLIRGRPDKMLPMIKALVGLIRNLGALSANCRKPLIDLGVTESLCDIFIRTNSAMNELARERNSIVSISSELSYVEGVRLEDLLELSLAALQSLAKEQSAQKIIFYQDKLLHTIVQIVMVREFSPPLHRACLGLLAEMVEYKDCARMMESEGLNSHLSEFINSTNHAIATYAAVIMYVINKDKPREYRNRMEKELVQSLEKQYHDNPPSYQESNRNSYAVSMTSNKSLITNNSRNNRQPDVAYQFPNVPTHVPSGYDNSGYIEDHDMPPRPNRQPRKQREPFRDVEL